MAHFEDVVTRRVAQNLKTIRKRKGLTAGQVADRATALGHPISRDKITALETGKKKSVSLVECLLLAAALDTIPLALIYGTVENEIEVLPGDLRTTAMAWYFFNRHPGEADLVALMDELRKVELAINVAESGDKEVGSLAAQLVGTDDLDELLIKRDAIRKQLN
jgi:transcriptional regulator with XRE-family HTH domain